MYSDTLQLNKPDKKETKLVSQNTLRKAQSHLTKILFKNLSLLKIEMTKLKLQMQMTINGYVAQSDGKNDWMTWNPDDELTAFMISMLNTFDTLLLGRKTAEDIIKY